MRSICCTGHEGFLVGGAVRDMLLGKQPKDFDILTTATPVQVPALCAPLCAVKCLMSLTDTWEALHRIGNREMCIF